MSLVSSDTEIFWWSARGRQSHKTTTPGVMRPLSSIKELWMVVQSVVEGELGVALSGVSSRLHLCEPERWTPRT